MVLSNKKLKQKLRASVGDSIAKSVAESVNGSAKNPESNRQIQSLKQLLDSKTQKPRLTKREKRRNTLSLHRPVSVNSSGNGEEKMEGLRNIKERKRKRDEEKKDGDGVKAKKAKMRKKKKKFLKKKKAAKLEKEKKVVDNGNGESGEQGMAETNKINKSEANMGFATKVYVGGIPYYSTEDDIRSYFESCGTITEVDCMRFPETGKFRGIVIISFKTEAAAKRALALDGSDMGGLFLKIMPYNKTNRANRATGLSPEIVEGYNRIYIGNLSWDITEEELRNFFADCSIASIRFGMDKETKEFRGYAHVDFSDSLSLTMALKLDQEIVCGRPIKIRCAVPVKGSEHAVAKNGVERCDPNEVPDIAITNGEEETHSTVTANTGSDNGGASSVSGKIRRRTCYECGEKGHLSTACPKKKKPDPTNSSAS